MDPTLRRVLLRGGQRFLAAFFAVFFAGAFLAGAFLATVFLAGAFFATVFFAAAFLAGAFFAGAFFATVFLAGAFLATVFLAGAFFAAALLAGAFFAAAFLAVVFFAAAFLAGAALAVVFYAPVLALAAATVVAGASFLAPETTAFRSAPARNFGTAVFLARVRSPVRGLRTMRAGRMVFSKAPNPVMATFSPLATSRVMVSRTDSRACCAAFLLPS
jgi:hypothetical protein